MGQLSGSRIINAIIGLFSALDLSDQTLLKKCLAQKKIKIDVTDSATAGTAFTKTLLWYNDTGVDHRVVSAKATAPIAVTGNAATYATFQVSRLDSAGANAAVVAAYATNATPANDMVANVSKDMALTAANVIVPAGAYLVAEVTKASTGVAITAATSRAVIEVRVEPT